MALALSHISPNNGTVTKVLDFAQGQDPNASFGSEAKFEGYCIGRACLGVTNLRTLSQSQAVISEFFSQPLDIVFLGGYANKWQG